MSAQKEAPASDSEGAGEMKIAVVGAGAIASAVGALLARSGAQVVRFTALLKRLSATALRITALGSTLQSLRRGRPAGTDYLNGEFVRLGQQIGVATPLNAKVVELVSEVERTGQFLPPKALRREMTERPETIP